MNSFPSGHSATAFMMAGIMCLVYRNWGLRALLLALASLVALSRVAVGAHWPIDVVGGAGLGWLAAGAGHLIAKWSPYAELRITRILFAIGLLGAAISIFFYDVTRYPGAYWLLRGIAIVVIGLLLLALYRELNPLKSAENLEDEEAS
jgi:hypothetical protein